MTWAATVTNIRSIPNPGRHGYAKAQLGVSRMAIPSPPRAPPNSSPSPLLEPPLASPILPVAPPRVDDDPSEQGPNVAIIIVLLVVGSLLLLVCIECYCRRLRGTTLCEALLACIMMEPWRSSPSLRTTWRRPRDLSFRAGGRGGSSRVIMYYIESRGLHRERLV